MTKLEYAERERDEASLLALGSKCVALSRTQSLSLREKREILTDDFRRITLRYAEIEQPEIESLSQLALACATAIMAIWQGRRDHDHNLYANSRRLQK